MGDNVNLGNLVLYLKNEIYSKMKKKDYDSIMASALGGQLMHNINLYKKI